MSEKEKTDEKNNERERLLRHSRKLCEAADGPLCLMRLRDVCDVGEGAVVLWNIYGASTMSAAWENSVGVINEIINRPLFQGKYGHEFAVESSNETGEEKWHLTLYVWIKKKKERVNQITKEAENNE